MGRVAVSGWGCVALAMLLLLLPFPWLAAALTAAGFHELCHAGAVRLLGGNVGPVKIGTRGAVMEVGDMRPGQELLAAAAGPAGSFLLLGLSRVFPRLALCGLVQGAYNLLPIYPLDGGRILYCLLRSWLPEERAVWICGWIGLAVGLAAGIFFVRQGLYPGAAAVFWVALRNIPCKLPELRVQ